MPTGDAELIESNRAAVLKYFGKTDEDIKNDVQIIIDWLNKQPHLPADESKIEVFLCRKKFSLEKTKKLLERFYVLKQLIPEIYTNWDPFSPEVQQAMDVHMDIPLRTLTPELHSIHISKMFDSNPERFNPWEMIKLSYMIALSNWKNEFNLGVHFICDLDGVTLSHSQMMTPSTIKKLLTVMMKGCGLRITGIHFINPTFGLDTIFSIVKLLVKPKIYNRIKIHHNLESLYEYIPREILPKEYGGNELSIFKLQDQWRKEIEAHRDLFLEEEKLISDESKRIGSLDEDIFGSMHGSFRSLQID